MEVVPFPSKQRMIWVCNCGCETFFLYDDGTTCCASCDTDQTEGAFMPYGDETEGVERTKVNKVFNQPDFALNSIERDLYHDDLAGVLLVFNDGRTRSVVKETADTDERRAWWRRRCVMFLNHVFSKT